MLNGVDVSSYQPGSFNTNGLAFAFTKVTEGLSYVNPTWTAQRDTIAAAGLVRGFYHYPHIANDPIAEADHFLSQLTLAPGDILCLDWEWYGQSVTDQQALDYRAKWIPYVQSKAPGHKVILYCDRNTWFNVDTTEYCGDGLWIADYVSAGAPQIQFRWTFHQYSDSPMDEDVANPAVFPNGIVDLKAWAGIPVIAPPPPAPTPSPTPAPAPVPEGNMPQQFTFAIAAGPDAQSYPAPAGSAWTAYPQRNFHLSYDKTTGLPGATATVRVAFHNGTSWDRPQSVTVSAAGPRVDVPGMTATTSKISVQCDVPGVGAAIEVW